MFLKKKKNVSTFFYVKIYNRFGYYDEHQTTQFKSANSKSATYKQK